VCMIIFAILAVISGLIMLTKFFLARRREKKEKGFVIIASLLLFYFYPGIALFILGLILVAMLCGGCIPY
jgi:hypothetical protein